MSMKKILMTAVAVTALSAGAASAASISVTSKVGGKYLQPLGTNVGTTFDAYTIANELNVATAPTAAANLVIAPTAATTIGQGQYVITYNITGGTFTTTSVTTASLVLTTNDGTTNYALLGATVSGTGTANTILASRVTSVNTVNANSIAFNVTIAPGEFLTVSTLNNTLKLGSARASVAVSGALTTDGGAAVDGGTVPAKTIIDYRSAYAFDATAANQTLSLASGFKKFKTSGSDATSAVIASGMGFYVNTGAVTGDLVYTDGAGTAALTSDLLTPVLTLAGDVASFVPTVGSQGADALTTNVFTLSSLTNIRSAGETVTLSQKASPLTPVAGNASSYSITPVVTMASGYTAPMFAPVALGAVSIEGTSFYAPWVGDGVNGIVMRIRLGNKTATKIPAVSVTLLNATGTVTTTTCTLGEVPASGDLVITSSDLKTCFGAFGRGDLRITAQTTSTNLTAKMRSTDAFGTVEQSLGGGTSVATAQ